MLAVEVPAADVPCQYQVSPDVGVKVPKVVAPQEGFAAGTGVEGVAGTMPMVTVTA